MNEIMGSSLLERSLFTSSSSPLRHSFHQKQSGFLITPAQLVPLDNRRVVRFRKISKFPVAAISEDLVKGSSSSSSSSSSAPLSSFSSPSPLPPPVPEDKPVKFKVRAVVTVRNKIKEDFKESIAKQLDALTDRIGRNVVLELFSTEIDPSKISLISKHDHFQ